MTDIYRVNANLPDSEKIKLLNDFILSLEGGVQNAKFDVNEITQIINDLNWSRKYLRNQSLGHTVSNYTDWTHFQDETGYSIWKIAPSDYTYNSANKLYFDDALINNKGEADAETSTFDAVYLYNGDSGSGYVDDTTEAGTEGGTEFNLMDSTNDYLYVGLSSTFSGVKFEFQTRGSGLTLKVEYYNASSGTGWQELTSNTNDLVDNTSDFESDGKIKWTIPGDWATTSVNSVTKYWIRISTTSTPVTTAKAYYIVPGDSVVGLLALSSTEVSEEEWAWCTFGSSIYVTIRNAGSSAFEGDYYITSSSSDTNKKNFFIYNHEYKGDYEDSTYAFAAVGWGYWQAPVEDKDLTTPPGSPSDEDRYLVITGDSGTDWAGLTNTIVQYDLANTSWDTFSPSQGMLVLVKDENDIYEYTGSAWLKPYGEGAGDMTKSTYDTDDDGIVDKAETVDDGAGNASTAADVKDAVDKKHDAATVGSIPLTISGQEITFNYDTNDFQLDGNDLQIKESGIDDTEIPFSQSGFTATDVHAAIVEVQAGGGSPTDAKYLVSEANATLSAELLTQDIGQENLFLNSSFDYWYAGTSVAPDGWTWSGAPTTIARESTEKKIGSYSLKGISTAGASFACYQRIHAKRGIDYWKGRYVTVGCWVKTSTGGNKVSAYLEDGATGFPTTYHTGGGDWELLTSSGMIANTATVVGINLSILSGAATTAYFDGAFLVEGSAPFAWSPHPEDHLYEQSVITVSPIDAVSNDTDANKNAIVAIPTVYCTNINQSLYFPISIPKTQFGHNIVLDECTIYYNTLSAVANEDYITSVYIYRNQNDLSYQNVVAHTDDIANGSSGDGNHNIIDAQAELTTDEELVLFAYVAGTDTNTDVKFYSAIVKYHVKVH